MVFITTEISNVIFFLNKYVVQKSVKKFTCATFLEEKVNPDRLWQIADKGKGA